MVDEMEIDTGAAPSGNDTRTTGGAVAVRSIEGWIIMVANINEEANEEDIQDMFGEWGEIKNVHLNLDRRTGYVKGYALIEYATLDEAKAAIDNANGTKLLDLTLSVDFAFVRPPPSKGGQGGAKGGRSSQGGRRGRSRSPENGRDREKSPARDEADI